MAHSRSPSQRVEHYRDQAAKIRGLAERTPVGRTRDQLLELADQYERLAAGVEVAQF
jgi:hypothetical protein